MPRPGEPKTVGIFKNVLQSRNNEFTQDELELAKSTGSFAFAAEMRGWTVDELDQDFDGRRFRKFIDFDGRRVIAANLGKMPNANLQELASGGKLDLIAAIGGASVKYWLRVARDGYRAGPGWRQTAVMPLPSEAKSPQRATTHKSTGERPDGGRFGIKRVAEEHLSIPPFTTVYPSGDPRQPLMNFKHNFRRGAAAIPVGHRALVHVVNCSKPKEHKDTPQYCAVGKVIWEIEFIGTLKDGERELERHAWRPETQEFPFYRPIRFLSRVDPAHNGPSVRDVKSRSGADFNQRPVQGGHVYRPESDYEALRNAVTWTWLADSGATSQTPATRPQSKILPGGSETALAEDGYYRERGASLKYILQRHRTLANRLATWLKQQGYTDIRWEKAHVDMEFRDQGSLCRVEIKTCHGVTTTKSIREAVGQLLEYNHYPPRRPADRWYIVLDQAPIADDISYLKEIGTRYSLPLHIGWPVNESDFQLLHLDE